MPSNKQNKDKVLILLSRFPYPLEKGDKLRAYHQIKSLSQEFDLILFTMYENQIEAEWYKEIEKYCSEIHLSKITFFSKFLNMTLALFSGKPIQTGYFFRFSAKRKINRLLRINSIKHIYCQLIRTSEYVKNIHHIPKTLDYMDALSFGMRRRIAGQTIFSRWVFRMEAKRLTRYEQQIFDYFENKTIISKQDRDLIAHPDKNQIVCIPNGIDTAFLEEIPKKESYDFVFVGNMSYPPNIEAVTYIVNEILPAFPQSELLIAGALPHPKVKKLAAKDHRVHISGWVDDIRESYLSARVFLAPMMTGTGMQNKLLEAMALGTPCITTSLANNAIEGEHMKEVIVADNKEELINACRSLLNDKNLRDSLSSAGKKFIREKYNWQQANATLSELIRNHL